MTLIIYKRSQRHTRFPDSRLYNNYSAFLYNLSSPQNVRYISKRLWENMNDQIVIDLDWVFLYLQNSMLHSARSEPISTV